MVVMRLHLQLWQPCDLEMSLSAGPSSQASGCHGLDEQVSLVSHGCQRGGLKAELVWLP